MHRSIVNILACPQDGAYPLILIAKERIGTDEIEVGRLRCPSCDTDFPITDGIADLCILAGAPSDIEAKKAEIIGRDLETASTYDDQFSWYQTQAELGPIVRQLRLVPGLRVLEIGCGNGRLSAPLMDGAGLYVGADFSMESLRTFKARTRRAVNLVRADANDLPFRPGHFDRIVSAQMLEHLPAQALREAFMDAVRNLLAPGGVFVLTTYNYDWVVRWQRQPRSGHHALGIYYFRYDAEMLRTELRARFPRVVTYGIRNRILPNKISRHGGRLSVWLDRVLSAVGPSRLTGELLLARCQVGGRRPTQPRAKDHPAASMLAQR